MRETSLAAYREINRTTRETNEEKVFHIIATKGPISNQDIARYLGWEINCVTGRTNGLVKQGKVCDAGYGRNEQGRKVHLWGVQQQLRLI